MTDPVRVAVTGAAGQIGYALVFRIASGAMLGPDQPVVLSMLEITPALDSLRGVGMELDDCAFPLLEGTVQTDDAEEAFDGVDVALLVGSRPRTKGMERADLLEANGAIFTVQGKALASSASKDVRVLVVGNPANTNCLIAMNNASGLDPRRFTAMTRLDHNRAKAQLAHKAGVPVRDIRRMTIWGNHSTTQYPDVFHAEIGGRPAPEVVDDRKWLEADFLPTVQKRGAAVIEARGASSAASAANAAVDHVRDWWLGTPAEDWVSMAVPSDGSYGVPEGLISSFPCTCSGKEWSIVQGLDLDDFSRQKVDASVAELVEERDTVQALGLLGVLTEPLLQEVDRALVGTLTDLLGRDLVAAYLHGSLAFGEFRPGASDVDVLVVVAHAMTDEARSRLAGRLLEVPLPGPLELSVVTAEAARSARLPMPYEVHVGGERVVLDRGAGDPDLAAHVTATLARGHALVGPPAPEVFAPVPWTAFLESILDDFDEAMGSGLTAGDRATTYAVLNACRVLQTLASPEGTVVGKEEAAAWALERLPAEHRPLVAAALTARRDPGAPREWDPEALRRFRTFAVGAAVRRRPGRKVAGLP